MGLSALPASLPPLSQVSRGSSPSCIETLQRFFQKRGFSRKAARFMAHPVRQSSARVYQTKWFSEVGSNADVFSTIANNMEVKFHQSDAKSIPVDNYFRIVITSFKYVKNVDSHCMVIYEIFQLFIEKLND
ncbi:hypothetical protein E2C01_030584 [Portunus trituberculatus]|uniref:Uncharacterized protein n=1 Tax=Portunus trituberculatus TaxID=210409 RepID=A0A5B7ER80_PORTR|nr:hypothetical protein [Portunus trituberculatus]